MDIDRHGIIGFSIVKAVNYLVHMKHRTYQVNVSVFNKLKKENRMAKIKMTGQKVTRTSSSGRSSSKGNSSKDVSGRKK